MFTETKRFNKHTLYSYYTSDYYVNTKTNKIFYHDFSIHGGFFWVSVSIDKFLKSLKSIIEELNDDIKSSAKTFKMLQKIINAIKD